MSYTATKEKYWLDGTGTTNAADVEPTREELASHYGYIYRITNERTGTVYVGEHKTGYERDSWRSYMGSGTYLKDDAKAYGVENFSKQLIEWVENDAQAKIREARNITAALKTGACYNSNNAYSIRRDPAENMANFAYKASWRSSGRLEAIINELKREWKNTSDSHEKSALYELIAAHELAVSIKATRFGDTGVLDPKDSRTQNEAW